MKKSELRQLVKEELEIALEHCGFCPVDHMDDEPEEEAINEFGDFPIPFLGPLVGIDWKESLKDLGRLPKDVVKAIIKRSQRLKPGEYRKVESNVWVAFPKTVGSKKLWAIKYFRSERDAKRYAQTGEEVRGGKVVKKVSEENSPINEIDFKKLARKFFNVGGGIQVRDIWHFYNAATVPEVNQVQKLINNKEFESAKKIMQRVIARGKKSK